MSGLAGFINLNQEKRLPIECLKQSSELIKHRGKDGQAYLSLQTPSSQADFSSFLAQDSAYLALGYRHFELAQHIFDPQEMQLNGLYIIFDGIIYNSLELKEALGLKQQEQLTDSKLLLHAYLAWGESFMNKLLGIWAFALWDGRQQKLVLSRDRFGSKPLYYLNQEGVFYFGSEIKQLHPLLKDKSIDAQMLWRMLKVSGMHHYAEHTVFPQIKILEPGQKLVVQQGGIKKEYYYRLDEQRFETSGLSFDDAAEYYLQLLKDSISLASRDQENIGCALSGGLDSTAILALLSSLKTGGIDSFSSWFEDERLDERQWIELANQSFAAKAHLVSPTPFQAWQSLIQATWYNDLPLGSGCPAQIAVFAATSENRIKVLLGGQGSDELTGGYRHAQYRYLADLLHQGKPRKLYESIKQIFRTKPSDERALILIKSALSFLFSEAQLYTQEMKHLHFEPFNQDYLYCAKQADMAQIQDLYSGKLSSFLYNMIYTSSLQTLLHFEDRMSSMAGVQSRTPFLDHRLVELAFSLPSDYKMAPPSGKLIHKEAIKSLLPPEILARKDKSVFGTPFTQRWMRNELKNEVQSIFTSESFRRRGIWDLSKIMDKWQTYLKGKDGDARMLFNVLSTEIWLQSFEIQP